MHDRTLVGDLTLAGVAAVGLTAVLLEVFAQPPARGPELERRAAVGVLVREVGDVRQRGEGTLVWHAARQGETIRDRDAIFVARGGQALIRLDDG